MAVIRDGVQRVCWPGLYRPNPAVYLQPEKGKPVDLSTKWVDFDTGEDLSNTYWAGGWVDFSGQLPSVVVEDELDQKFYDEYRKTLGGRKIVTYLLHPDKFEDRDRIKPAIGMIPNLSAGSPGKPFAYALRISWEVAVMLRTKPANRANPRGWFEGYGVPWVQLPGLGIVGEVHLYSGKKRRRTVWREVKVRYMDDESPGPDWRRLEF